jgi:hypothetical protein
VDQLVRATAESFLAATPSRRSLEPEAISRLNAGLLANDSQLEGDLVQPDNLLAAESFVPETVRYGGPALLPANLDYFQLSSAHTFLFRDNTAGLAKNQLLPVAMLELLRPTLGLATSREELLELTRYAAIWAKESGALFVGRGNEAYDRSAPLFRAKVRGRLDNWLACSEGWGPPLAAGGRRLAWEARDLPLPRRQDIAIGQIHMMANRLGLSNLEEIYLGQILVRSLEDLLDGDRELEARVAARFAATDEPEPLAAVRAASLQLA